MKKTNFISIDGICNECGYPVICEQPLDDDYDFHMYCSNPNCKNHIGKHYMDMELGDDEFMTFIRFEREKGE